MNPPASSTTSGAEPGSAFRLKAVAVSFLALPLVLVFHLPAGLPHLESGSAVPLFYAVVVSMLFLRFAAWLFFDGSGKTVSWFLPPFWLCLLPAIALELLVVQHSNDVVMRIAPVLFPPNPTPQQFIEQMMEQIAGDSRPVVLRDPMEGFAGVFLHFIFILALPIELLKWLCASVHRSVLPAERIASAFASGLAYGLVNATLASINYGSGFADFSTFLVRFVSLAGLHAIWAALTAGFMEGHRRPLLSRPGLASCAVRLLPSVLLQALFESCVLYDRATIALLLVALSFALFLWMLRRIERGLPWAVSTDAPATLPCDWLRRLGTSLPPAWRRHCPGLSHPGDPPRWLTAATVLEKKNVRSSSLPAPSRPPSASDDRTDRPKRPTARRRRVGGTRKSAARRRRGARRPADSSQPPLIDLPETTQNPTSPQP